MIRPLKGHRIRQEIEQRERQVLSPFACWSGASKGRDREETPDPTRTCFQRDRDRILHCKSFRRLAHKTQVFLSPAGDHYRTRITHTLEVAQIARTIARALSLNEDLTEAIALGHDLGHTPFGHAGEATLNKLLPGGFRHVVQSIRVVNVLERDGAGLNLTYEVLQGIRTHSKGKGAIICEDLHLAGITLEAQIVRIADIIAYLNHDLDDAIRAQILEPEEIPRDIQQSIGQTHSERITFMVDDVLANTDLTNEQPRIQLSDRGLAILYELREFLYQRVYDNPIVHNDMIKAERVLTALWEYFVVTDADKFRSKFWPQGLHQDEIHERAVADFISMMTDRYALRLHEELLLPQRWKVI